MLCGREICPLLVQTGSVKAMVPNGLLQLQGSRCIRSKGFRLGRAHSAVQSVSTLCCEHPVLSMACISKAFQISLDGRKPVLLSDDMVESNEEHGEFLRLRASSWKLLQILCGNPKKNSTLSDSTLLQGLKEQRNLELKKVLQPEMEEEGDAMGLGAGTKKNTTCKKKQVSDTTVDIEVNGTQVTVLCPKFRGAQADLLVLLDPDMLTAVFHHLLPDCENKKASAKFSPKKRKSPEGPGVSSSG